MPDDGYRPAYNFQYAVDTSSKAILGVDVVNARTDGGQMRPMYEKISRKYGNPKRYLADGGFKNAGDIEFLSKNGCEVFIPLQKNKKTGKPFKASKASQEIQDWRLRMNSETSKEIYRRRAFSVEYVNAELRNRGLYQLKVRGLAKAKMIAHLYALAHNIARSLSHGIM